jgi:hypothetical protein
MEFFGLVLGFSEEMVKGLEFPAALEVFAIEAFAEFFDESFGLFVDRFVAHRLTPFYDLIPLMGSWIRGREKFVSSCFHPKTLPREMVRLVRTCSVLASSSGPVTAIAGRHLTEKDLGYRTIG